MFFLVWAKRSYNTNVQQYSEMFQLDSRNFVSEYVKYLTKIILNSLTQLTFSFSAALFTGQIIWH